MNAKAATCPPERVLADFGLGKLDGPALETVNRHLESCVDCRQLVASVSGDTFLHRIQQSQNPKDRRAGGRLPDGETHTFVPDESQLNVLREPQSRLQGPLNLPAQAPPPRQAMEGLPPELANSADHEVLKELGRGGMGVVYLARNRLMDRLEVLKVVSARFVDRPEVLERFQQEIRSGARLNHPNIVAVYSVLRLGNVVGLAMEHVHGDDLARVVKRRGPLPVQHAAFYGYQAALGLQHAHERGMAHRDIKPSNLILAIIEKKHVIKILDFGLAKATSVERVPGITETGQVLGTPEYMAPEQTRDSQKADIRSDIYSLGCTLYCLLSGSSPFPFDSLYDILHAHQTLEPRALNLVRPEVPAELAAVVSRMMAKDPARQYQTPAEVAKALSPFFKAGIHLPPVVTSDTSPSVASALPGTAIPASVTPLVVGSGVAIPVGRVANGLPVAIALSVTPVSAFGSTKKTSSARGRRLGWLIAIGLLLSAPFFARAVLFKFNTVDGVVVLTVNEPNPEILIDGNAWKVAWAAGGKKAEITLPSGSRNIEMKKAGFKAVGQQVIIEQGMRTILFARLEPLAPANLEVEVPRRPVLETKVSAPVIDPTPEPAVIAPFEFPAAKKRDLSTADPAVIFSEPSIELFRDRRAILDVMPLPSRRAWDDATLLDVANDLRSAYQMNVVLDEYNLQRAGISAMNPRVTWKDRRASLELALKMVFDPIKVGWTIQHDVLLITSEAQCKSSMELVGYKTGLAVTMTTTPRPPIRTKSGTLVPDRRASRPDFIGSVTKVFPITWSEVGGRGALKLGKGVLLVAQTLQVQREIERQFQGHLTRIEVPATPAPIEAENGPALSTPISLSLAGESLDEVLKAIDKKMQLPIVIKSKSLEEAGIKVDDACHLELNRVPLRVALEFLLAPFELTYVVDGKVILITTFADAKTLQTAWSYDVAKMNAAFGSGDSIMECVTGLVHPTTWSQVGGAGSLRLSPDKQKLIVTQTYLGHVEAHRLFSLIEAAIPDRR